MKHIYLLILFFTAATTAQSFELTPEGLISNGNEFVVIAQKGTQAELYKTALLYLNSIYKSPQNVLSEIEGEAITISAKANNSVRRNSLHVFDMFYNFTLEFKDDKIRMSAPKFELTTFTDKRQTLHLVWTKASLGGSNLGIYGKDNKLKSEKAKEDIENYFNNYINLLSEAIDKKEDNW
jgi:hypothetical protein